LSTGAPSIINSLAAVAEISTQVIQVLFDMLESHLHSQALPLISSFLDFQMFVFRMIFSQVFSLHLPDSSQAYTSSYSGILSFGFVFMNPEIHTTEDAGN
jgi:hypothetical protein